MVTSYNIEQEDVHVVGSQANIVYTFDFLQCARHLVAVTMTILDCRSPTIVVTMPAWSPGSYKIRDYVAFQGNVQARSGTKRLDIRWLNKHSLEITLGSATTVELVYLVYCNERSVRTNHVTSEHAFLVPTGLCMMVEGRTNEMHHVQFANVPSRWNQCSTALSPVQTQAATFRSPLGAINYDVLADSPIELGSHQVYTATILGGVHELAIVSPLENVDIEWFFSVFKKIVEVEANVFGGIPYDRYVCIIQFVPSQYGGLEHARSSVNMVDPAALGDVKKMRQLLSLLAHEYFHLWNVKRIRPIELGPFTYTTETYTPMLWLAEGLTSYYDDLFSYRCGFYTEKDYIEILGTEHITKLFQVPGRKNMSVRDSSFLAWVKLYTPNADASNRFPSYYLKGGIIFLLLDIYIIDHSDAQKCFDDALVGLWNRYRQNPAVGISEDECITIIESSTNVQIRELLNMWLRGVVELPYEMLSFVGYELVQTTQQPKPATFGEQLALPAQLGTPSAGWLLAETAGRVVVKSVDDDGAAASAGIAVDDELLAVNNVRVSGIAAVERQLRQPGETILLLLQRDGVVVTAQMARQAASTWELQPIASPSKRQILNKAKWLRRPL
jgi:predicted metalloprotease with PDZ domain